jgi:large subunit ribosomal protein L1
MKRGKKYTAKAKTLSNVVLAYKDALAQVSSLATSKFAGKIEVHIALNLNEKERKQPVRGNVIYSKPVSKPKKVLVLADPQSQDIAKEAGADYFGLDEYIQKIKDGWIDFDVAIATPSAMSKIAPLGRILGTKGLMPNPKSGTVTDDIKKAVESYKGGKIDYKSDETGVVHTIIGTKASSPEELDENFIRVVKSVLQNTNKAQRLALKSVFIAPTMGPSLKLDVESIYKEI